MSQQVSSDHYEADTCIVWCSDDRFWDMLDHFITGKEFIHPDIISIVGGARDLASPRSKSGKEYLLRQIKKSIKLHGTPVIHLMVHTGCGAYALRGVEFRTAHEEIAFLEREVKKAEREVRHYLSRDYARIRVKKYVACFDGLYEV